MTLPLAPVRAPRPRPPALSLIKASPFVGVPEPLDARTPSDAWWGGFVYYPYSHSAAELRDVCDFSTVDRPALATPGQATLAHVAGGTIVAGTYGYRVSATNANGQTVPGVEQTITTGSTGSISVTWNRVHGAAGYKVYGRTGGAELLIATVADEPEDVSGTLSYVDTGAVTPSGAMPVANTTGGPGSYTNPQPVGHHPALIVVEDSCSAFGFLEHDFVDRVRVLLDNASPNAIEREFWTGALTQAAGTGNNYLTNASSVTDLTPGGGPPSVKRGLQILEDALSSCGYGGQGMIHTQPQTTPDLTGARRVGDLLLSAIDNIIVPGSGYPGTGPSGAAPAAGTAWMYATDLVAVWIDTNEAEIVADELAQNVDRDVNDITYRAIRHGGATFDGACHFGVRVTLST